jgi:uncharacterized membrane protein required for colicin V production
MIDLIIGLFILLFVFLGLREGLAKTLGSIVLIFLALFFSNSSIDFLARVSPELTKSGSFAASAVFLGIWAVIYALLDFLLGLILRRIITIIVLGPLDRVAGTLLGVFKGLLIAGIVLQLSLCFPIAAQTKKRIMDSSAAKFSIATYQWAYPLAKKWTPYFNRIIKENLLDRIQKQEKIPEKISAEIESIKKMSPDEVMDKLIEYEKVKKETEAKIKKLLEEKNLMPSSPTGRPR